MGKGSLVIHLVSHLVAVIGYCSVAAVFCGATQWIQRRYESTLLVDTLFDDGYAFWGYTCFVHGVNAHRR